MTARVWWPIAVLACACGEDYADVAVLVESPALTMPIPTSTAPTCLPPGTAPDLPEGEDYRGGAEAQAPAYLFGEYDVGEGPGLQIVARDAYRLFVNGHLVDESTEALTPRFVPLTFLPGSNVVSVLVASSSQTPQVAVRVDELSGPIFGGDQVRVSTEPSGAWSMTDFDDSDWRPVQLGPTLDASGCDLTAPFTDADRVQLLGVEAPSESAVFRFTFDIAPIGFGEGTTGGGTTPATLVTDVESFLSAVSQPDEPAVVLIPEGVMQVSGPDDDVVRIACSEFCPDEPSKELFPLLPADAQCDTSVEVLRNEKGVSVGSNKTIVGLGRGTQLRGARLAVEGRSNVIFRNLGITEVNRGLIEAGDGISINESTDVWVDHCTFKWISDGFTDVQNSSGITFSWVRNEGVNPEACSDTHPRSNELTDSQATFHHCFWNHVFERSPLVNGATSRVHLFNNLVSDDTGYAVGAACGAQVRVEQSRFEAVGAPTDRRTCSTGEDVVGLIDATLSNSRDGDTGADRLRGIDAAVPADAVFVPPYAYALDAVQDVSTLVRERAGAGAQWAQPLVE